MTCLRMIYATIDFFVKHKIRFLDVMLFIKRIGMQSNCQSVFYGSTHLFDIKTCCDIVLCVGACLRVCVYVYASLVLNSLMKKC